MKKEYIKPEIDVLEIITATILSTSKLPVGGDDDTTNEGDSNKRRGSWGNLWE